MKPVLVTGASGYLGRHILIALKEAGIPAIALARSAGSWPAHWADEVGDIRLVTGTPLAPEAWLDTVGPVGAIIHAAGVVKHSRADVGDMHDVNVRGTQEMVRAASKLGARMLFMSTSGTVACFDDATATADEHAPFAEKLAGRWPYYASKIEAERASRALADELGVPLAMARLPILLGPKDHKRRSTTHVTRVLDARVPLVPSGGVNFADVRDVATALVRLTQLDAMQPVYHFPGTVLSLADFFQLVCEVSGATLDRPHAPRWVVQGLAMLAENLPRKGPLEKLPDSVVLEMATCHWGLSSLWSEQELGYRSRPPRETLSDTVEWLRTSDEGVGATHG